MASSVKTRSPSSAVTGPRRAALTGYRWLLLAFLLLGGVQIFLAGLGAFRLGHPMPRRTWRSLRTARSGSRWEASRW
jgi:hypothetical protein